MIDKKPTLGFGSSGLKELPAEIDREVKPSISALVSTGWHITDARYAPEHFGNWWVELTRKGLTIRLVKDRSQYMAHGPDEQLKSHGLCTSFDDPTRFADAIARFAADDN